jgi:hypothetical protein
MTRSIVTALAACVAVAIFSGTGCAPTGIGDPCVPEQEYQPDFLGFNFHEVSTESASFQCMTRLCLVNHFQGRVSCPYGQNADGAPRTGTFASSFSQAECASPNPVSGKAAGCCTPGIRQPVTGPLVNGQPTDMMNGMTVLGQCTHRTADQAVYCSCRCANINGGTDDGANYCTCPDGFSCTQLVSSIGQTTNEGLTGSYCIKTGTAYNPNGTDCSPTALCDPNVDPKVTGCTVPNH